MGPSKNIFFRACRASVEIRKTRIPAKGFAPAREARTGIRQRRSATASLATTNRTTSRMTPRRNRRRPHRSSSCRARNSPAASCRRTTYGAGSCCAALSIRSAPGRRRQDRGRIVADGSNRPRPQWSTHPSSAGFLTQLTLDAAGPSVEGCEDPPWLEENPDAARERHFAAPSRGSGRGCRHLRVFVVPSMK